MYIDNIDIIAIIWGLSYSLLRKIVSFTVNLLTQL